MHGKFVQLKRTPLHRAAMKGKVEVVRALLQAKADSSIKDQAHHISFTYLPLYSFFNARPAFSPYFEEFEWLL